MGQSIGDEVPVVQYPCESEAFLIERPSLRVVPLPSRRVPCIEQQAGQVPGVAEVWPRCGRAGDR